MLSPGIEITSLEDISKAVISDLRLVCDGWDVRKDRIDFCPDPQSVTTLGHTGLSDMDSIILPGLCEIEVNRARTVATPSPPAIAHPGLLGIWGPRATVLTACPDENLQETQILDCLLAMRFEPCAEVVGSPKHNALHSHEYVQDTGGPERGYNALTKLIV
jgi:hypothetical protein